MDRVRRDALLVVRAQLGDRRSLAESVGYWHEPVWQYVRRMLDRPGLAELPASEREVLMVFYLHDLALEECAQVLAVPAGTVKSRLFRARRLLRDHLIERGTADDRATQVRP